MLKMIQNNEATQVCEPMPLLINNFNRKGIKIMTSHQVSYPAKNGNSPEYRTWAAMKRRCYNPNVIGYENYGKRNITICEEWQTFEGFFGDMGLRPENHTIERIENDLGYSPDNCKWATKKEQADNRRDNVNIEKDGVVLNQVEWARKLGFSDSTIKMRIRKGMSPEDAVRITNHINKPKPFNVYDKNTMKFIGAWESQVVCAEELGIPRKHIGSVLNGNRKSTGGYIMEHIKEGIKL